MLFVLLFLFISSSVFSWKTVLKQAALKAKIVHFSLLLVSFSVLILSNFRIAVPSPTNLIQTVVDAIFRLQG